MSRSVFIYRVELPNGQGPYYGKDDNGEWFSFTTGNWSQPNPWNDGIPDFNDNHRCGFMSIDQYKKWFSCRYGRKTLKSYGFKIYQYKVANYSLKIGRNQVTFRHDKRKRTGRIFDLVTLKETK